MRQLAPLFGSGCGCVLVISVEIAKHNEGDGVTSQHDGQPGGEEQRTLTVLPPRLSMPRMATPKQTVTFLYGPDQFEEFVKEWVPTQGAKYDLVERQGGAGDHGIDVAGFLTQAKLEGEWHNYQCKQYKRDLSWTTAAQEMRKMFVAAAAGHFTVPSRYVFVALTFAASLKRLISKPSECRAKFLEDLSTTKDKLVTKLDDDERRKVKELAEGTDFGMFSCVDLDQVLEEHMTTPHWLARFPHVPPAKGPIKLTPPERPRHDEARYVQRLVDVYRERFPDKINTLDQVEDVAEAKGHLLRQRVAFFAAESMRVFARDSTTPEYFDQIKEDIYTIVVEASERSHPNGWERHAAVMICAGAVEVTETILKPYVGPEVRKGVCHHLANDDRLVWCREGEQ
ncbi:ABC-three component system protein [Streptomyces thermocoprophilus]|uniref:ABC-three component system protein n=1 Tax=Streptomyces thermocoprophilus TaxID=78356 RepID=A0ABV5VMM1_9ACTN